MGWSRPAQDKQLQILLHAANFIDDPFLEVQFILSSEPHGVRFAAEAVDNKKLVSLGTEPLSTTAKRGGLEDRN